MHQLWIAHITDFTILFFIRKPWLGKNYKPREMGKAW
ncbi:uncharacterized protein METZ01_LOCUS274188 [marine metagenome]|uniref:Uncharacterized protein n=1 Tax=marine metagenome TaxID=408172 RepID=A0A382K8V9_9ZZZZ